MLREDTREDVQAFLTVMAGMRCAENCRGVKNHKREMSCPVLGFSRRETFLFDVRLGRIASLVFDPPNSTGTSFTFGTASLSEPTVVKFRPHAIQLLGLALPPLRFKSCVGEVEPPRPESQPFRI